MGDLFDGYGSTLAPRKTASGIPAFDEMFGVPSHPGDPAESREAYRELYQALAQMTQEELRGWSRYADRVDFPVVEGGHYDFLNAPPQLQERLAEPFGATVPR